MGERSSTAAAEPAVRTGKRAAPLKPNTDAAAASFAALTHKLDYLDAADIKRVRDAYRFADEAENLVSVMSTEEARRTWIESGWSAAWNRWRRIERRG